MSRRRVCGLMCLIVVPVLLGVALTPLVAADDTSLQPSSEWVAQNGAPTPPKGAPGSGKEAKRFPDAAEVTKGMQATEGMFTLYRDDPADKEHDPEKLLAKIPRSLLGQDLLFATSLSRGRMSGWMWRDALVRWEIVGKQLTLTTPDLRYIQKQGQPVAEAVARTYTDTFMTTVPIAGMSPQGDVIIDLGRLLKSDLAGVSFLGGRVRPELSTWAAAKAFPDNVLIDVDLALANDRGGSKVGVSYAFRRLPALGSYQPRAADPRVGYFLTAKMDWAKKYHERDNFERYIHRWQLEKRDPSLKLSPPKKPIVFIIEKTVPIQWRRWIREGIEEWNVAFEKIGFTDAVVVQQQTEDNEYADYDPEDARYNFLRWGVSGRAFAMAPSRVDPRTGQILDADVLFDDAFVRAWMYNFDLYGPSAVAEFKGPGYREWVQANPGLVPPALRIDTQQESDDPDAALWAAMEAELHKQGRCTCSYASGMQQQLALAYNAMIATGTGPKKMPERFIGEAIREIVTHEVGHTLGLRHNFQASYWLSLDEIIRRRNETDEPTSASVMDYTPLLFFADDDVEKVRHFVTPTLGPYDEWAVEYGYATPEGQSEEEMLKAIASRGTEPALNYATDEDTRWIYSPDPRVNRYDLSDDPVAYSRARAALTEKLLRNIDEWALQDGEPRHYLTRAFDVIWYERTRNLGYVTRVVTGQYFNRDQQGDPNARPAFELLEPAKQRAALQYLCDTIFNEEFFLLDPDVLNMLAPTRWSHWGSYAPVRLDYPLRDRIHVMQTLSLLDLMAPMSLTRVYDAELKSDAADKFTAAELITTLRDQIWSDLERADRGTYTDAKPFISSLRRNLQRDHLFGITSLAVGRPGATMSKDLHAMVALALRELSEKIEQTLDRAGDRIDFASKAHLVESKSRIDRILDAPLQVR